MSITSTNLAQFFLGANLSTPAAGQSNTPPPNTPAAALVPDGAPAPHGPSYPLLDPRLAVQLRQPSQPHKELTQQLGASLGYLRAALTLPGHGGNPVEAKKRQAELLGQSMAQMNQVRTTLQNNPDLALEVIARAQASTKSKNALNMLGLFGDQAMVHRMAVAVKQAGGADRWTKETLAERLNANQDIDDATLSHTPGDPRVEKEAAGLHINTLWNAYPAHGDAVLTYLMSLDDRQFAQLGAQASQILNAGGMATQQDKEAFFGSVLGGMQGGLLGLRHVGPLMRAGMGKVAAGLVKNLPPGLALRLALRNDQALDSYRPRSMRTNNAAGHPDTEIRRPTNQPAPPDLETLIKWLRLETRPTGPLGGVPTGWPAKIPANAKPENVRSLNRENESARTLAKAGYRVEQNPKVPGPKNPDYRIEGKIFDCYAPDQTTSARNIAKQIEKHKVKKGQASRIVLNLDDSNVTVKDMRKQLTDWPVPGLDEVIVIKKGQIVQVWP